MVTWSLKGSVQMSIFWGGTWVIGKSAKTNQDKIWDRLHEKGNVWKCRVGMFKYAQIYKVLTNWGKQVVDSGRYYIEIWIIVRVSKNLLSKKNTKKHSQYQRWSCVRDFGGASKKYISCPIYIYIYINTYTVYIYIQTTEIPLNKTYLQKINWHNLDKK